MILRIGKPHRFSYVYEKAGGARSPVKDASTLSRIQALAIPPAYKNVQISSSPTAKIQAIGYDDKGRKQYKYHRNHVAKQARLKYEKIIKLRPVFKKIESHINRKIKGVQRSADTDHSLGKDVLICLLLKTMIDGNMRIGNRNKTHSYGLTTVEVRHIVLTQNGKIGLRFVGKKQVVNEAYFDNPHLAAFLRSRKLSAASASERIFQPVTSSDVNAYLQEFDASVTTKDLRTWRANILFMKEIKRGFAIKDAIAAVAEKLHNTPAVCKSSYIDPSFLKL